MMEVMAVGWWCTVCEFFEQDEQQEEQGDQCINCGCDGSTHRKVEVVTQ